MSSPKKLGSHCRPVGKMSGKLAEALEAFLDGDIDRVTEFAYREDGELVRTVTHPSGVVVAGVVDYLSQ